MKIDQIIAEGAGNIGAQIKSAYQKIYNAGDDAVEFAYYDSPIFAQYWDEYEGDLDSIIAEVEPSELQIILDELTAAAEDQDLNEFAPPGSGDDDGFSEETLKRLAAQWYNGDEDPRVERTLMAAGWEIGQDEGYEDEPGVFVVQAGDINGNSYLSWPAHELKQGVAEGGKGSGRRGPDAWDTTPGKVGRVEKTATGIRHHADPSRYGGTETEPELDKLDKSAVSAMDRALGVKWDRESRRYFSPLKVDENQPQEKEADYGPEYQDMVSRVKKLAGLGPLKTVYDPKRRVYRNVPVAVQPAQQPKK